MTWMTRVWLPLVVLHGTFIAPIAVLALAAHFGAGLNLATGIAVAEFWAAVLALYATRP